MITLACLLAIMFGDLAIHSAAAAHLAAVLHRRAPDPLQHLFWDSNAYADGIGRILRHQLPYDTDPSNIIFYAYTPAFAWAGACLAHLMHYPTGHALYDAIFFASTLTLQLILAPFFIRTLSRQQCVALLCLLPLTIFMSSNFWSGNMHTLFYAAALLAAITGLRRNQWLPYYAVTVIAAASQPVFLLLLLLPAFAGRRQILPTAATVIAVAAAHFVQRLATPQMYAAFQQSVAVHMTATRDFGEGVLGAATAWLPHAPAVIPLVLQLAFSAVILLTLLYLRRRVTPSDPRWWALLALAIILVNPRIMPYDSVLAIVPALFFLLTPTRSPARWPLVLATTAVCIVLHKHLGLTPLLVVGFVLGTRTLLATPSPMHQVQWQLPHRMVRG